VLFSSRHLDRRRMCCLLNSTDDRRQFITLSVHLCWRAASRGFVCNSWDSFWNAVIGRHLNDELIRTFDWELKTMSNWRYWWTDSSTYRTYCLRLKNNAMRTAYRPNIILILRPLASVTASNVWPLPRSVDSCWLRLASLVATATFTKSPTVKLCYASALNMHDVSVQQV